MTAATDRRGQGGVLGNWHSFMYLLRSTQVNAARLFHAMAALAQDVSSAAVRARVAWRRSTASDVEIVSVDFVKFENNCELYLAHSTDPEVKQGLHCKRSPVQG